MEFGDWIPSLYPVLSIGGESPGRCSGWTWERRSYKWGEDLRIGGTTGPTGGSIGVIARKDAKRWLWRGWDTPCREVLTYSWVLSRKWQDTISAVGRSLLHCFGDGLKATTVFADSIALPSGLPVPVSALFSGRHLSPDHTAFYLFVYLIIACFPN